MRNPNCDGKGPHAEGEVRRYPLGGQVRAVDGSALILCYRCWVAENKYRYERAVLDNNGKRKAIPEHDKWPQHNWFEAEVYADA